MVVVCGLDRVLCSSRCLCFFCGCCCCCRPTPPACSCGGVRQPNFSREALSSVHVVLSPVIIELGKFVMYCMQFIMSVSVVSMVSWCGVVVFLGAMHMLAIVMSLKCFVCIFRGCISVLSVLMACGVLMCVNVVSDLK